MGSGGLVLADSALAFRGYNTTNLGRTAELLDCSVYQPFIEDRLKQASAVCAEVLHREVDLVARVRSGAEPDLKDYAEAVALVFATEVAQLDLLKEVHGVDPGEARLAFGYSLGELVALAATGRLVDDQALRIPLAMASDCAALADSVTMGVLFSRADPLDEAAAHRLCDAISQQGEGVIAVSAVLSPNTLLLLGQHKTVDGFRSRMKEALGRRVHLRLNGSQWPPLHTPIVWQEQVTDRASVMIQALEIRDAGCRPPVFSLVTGRPIDEGPAIRAVLRDWVDRPQRLWDAVTAVLCSPAATVLHVGPAPNVIPATFRRLGENIAQIRARPDLSGLGARAIGRMVERPWLSSRLPQAAALLRAPQIQQIVLEDWLLENAPS